MSNTIMLDPTAELAPAERQTLPRLDTLKDATIGLLDISKPRGKESVSYTHLTLPTKRIV